MRENAAGLSGRKVPSIQWLGPGERLQPLFTWIWAFGVAQAPVFGPEWS
jgi:hypothetical protein